MFTVAKLNSNFNFNLYFNWVELGITFVLSDHPPPTHHPATRTSSFEPLLDYLWSWNLAGKLYSTKLGQLAN